MPYLKCLVVGSTGFVGQNLVRELLKKRFSVICISRSIPKRFTKNIHYAIDISDQKQLKKVFTKHKFDVVFHIAAFHHGFLKNNDIRHYIETNILGTLNILTLAHEYNSKKIIYSSSASVYGRHLKPPIKESIVNPEEPYASSKLIGEEICQMFRQYHNLPVTVLRYSSIYGNGHRETSVLPIFVSQALKNQPIRISGKGHRSQDFVHVKDVADANILAAMSKTQGTFNIGSGEETSLRKLAETIIKVFDSTSKILYDRLETADETRFSLDITSAQKALKYIPKYSLTSGLISSKNYYEKLNKA